MFDNILERRIEWPDDISPECRDLIDCLLCSDPGQRLGARGAGEVRSLSCRIHFRNDIILSHTLQERYSVACHVTDPPRQREPDAWHTCRPEIAAVHRRALLF